MTASILTQDPNTKIIYFDTDLLHIFGEIFVKPQNDT